MNAWIELVVKVKQYGVVLQEMINLKRFYFTMISAVGGTTAVETDESKMEFAPLPLEKQIRCVYQNWLNWPFALFQVVDPICIKTYHQQKYQLLLDPFLPPVALLKTE